MNGVRVLPLLLLAGLSLFALKSAGLMLSGGYMLTGSAPASAQDPQQNDAPGTGTQDNAAAREGDDAAAGTDGGNSADAAQADRTQTAQAASDAGPADNDKNTPAAGENTGPAEGGMAQPKGAEGDVAGGGATRSELAVLEGLSGRRKALDERARELDLQQNLIKAAEKRVEARISELKQIEARIESRLKAKDDKRKAQYQRLVKMYANMKPKDAARIFDRLELDVLTGLVEQMKPRAMAAILEEMAPQAAERLTLEIANGNKPAEEAAASLPKIEGQ